MAAHPLGPAPSPLFDSRSIVSNILAQRARIVPGARHDLRAEEVGLLLEVAAVPQKQRAQSELAALRDRRSGRAADNRATHRTSELPELQPGILRLGRVGGAVPKQDVGELVRHHPHDLTLARRSVEHATVHEHRSARKRKGVDLFQIDRRE